MVVNGKSAAAFGIAPGLVCVLLVASQAGCAGASSSVREAPATAGSQGVSSSKLQAVTVKRPVAPSAYRLPRRAMRVSSSRQLLAAMVGRRRATIVLAPGRYARISPFFDRDGVLLPAAAHWE